MSWLLLTLLIFQTRLDENLLYLKSTSVPLCSLLLRSFIQFNSEIFRNREELLEELQKSLGPLSFPYNGNVGSPPTPPPTPHSEGPPSSSPPTFPRVNQVKWNKGYNSVILLSIMEMILRAPEQYLGHQSPVYCKYDKPCLQILFIIEPQCCQSVLGRFWFLTPWRSDESKWSGRIAELQICLAHSWMNSYCSRVL